MIFSPSLCRAARALLAWKQDDLAAAAGVAKHTILKYENGLQSPYPRTLRDLVSALEGAGVVFIEPVDGVHEGGVAIKHGVAVLKTPRRSKVEDVEDGEEGINVRAWDDDANDISPRLMAQREFWAANPERWDKLSPSSKALLGRELRFVNPADAHQLCSKGSQTHA